MHAPPPAVVLAAGASTRYGSPKQRVLLPEVLGRLQASPVGEIVVVWGAHGLAPQLADGARLVHCVDWHRGPGATLRAGLSSLQAPSEHAVVCLADGPRLDPRSVARVLAVWEESGASLVAASYGGQRSHPVVIARRLWARVPDRGARSLPALLVPCDDLDEPGDVDLEDE